MFERRQKGAEDGPGNGQRTTPTRYQMRQKLIAFGDDFWIKNEQGERVFKVDGQILRLRKTLLFEDVNGNELCQIQDRPLRIKQTMEIEDPRGGRIAVVSKALINLLGDHWTAKMADGSELTIKGNVLDHEYSISEGRATVAEVSKKWFSFSDSYGIEIAPGQNDVVILAITVVIDMMAHGDDGDTGDDDNRQEN